MTLDEIRKNLEGHLMDAPFVLDKQTVGLEQISEFCSKTFEVDRLTMNNPKMTSGIDVTLQGITSVLGVDGVKLSMTFYEMEAEIGIKSVFTMPETWLFPIPGIDRFSIGNFSFNLQLSGPGADITGSLNGVIHLGKNGVDVPIAIGLPICWSGWLLKGDFSGIQLPGPAALLEFIGVNSLAAVVPPGLDQLINSLSIKDVEIFFSPADARLFYISAEVELADPSAGWQIITDKFMVRGLKLYIRVDHLPDGSNAVSLEIGGVFTVLKDVTVPVFIRKMGGSQQWSLSIANQDGIPVPTLSDIARFIDGYDLSQLLPKTFTDLGDLAIYELGAGFDFDKTTLSYFSFNIGTTESWSFFGTDKLSLKDVGLDFTITNPLDGASRSVSGSVAGVASLGNNDFTFYADHPGSGGGWLLTGGTVTGQQFNLTEVAGSLLGLFDISLPGGIPKVVIEFIEMSFNTLDKSWAFQAETSAFAKDDSGSEVYEGKGTVEIHSGNGGVTVNASWNSGSEDETLFGIIGNMTHVLGLDFTAPPSELDLSLVAAAFYYHSTDSLFAFSAKSKNGRQAFLVTAKDGSAKRGYVFGLDFREDLCLSDLPVVGKDFHLLDSIYLQQLRILLSTDDFEDFVIPGLPLLSGTDTPELAVDPSGQTLQIKKGLCLNGKINLIDEVVPFNLQIGANREKSGLTAAGSDGPKAFWLPIQKAFGPIHFKRLGLAYGDKQILLLLDASFTATALDVALDGLALGLPLTDPANVSVYLRGMDIDFNSNVVAISGGFLESGTTPVSYSGEALIKAGPFSISGIGSYATAGGNPSLFIYAMLLMPLGGPPYFFINGLSAGFGYNRDLIIPAADKLTEFPLVALALGKCDKEQMLQNINNYITVAVGEDWLAAGIKFNSFKMIDSFALLTVAFGTRFEVALLGFSEINVPLTVPGAKQAVDPIAHAQLALEAVFAPDDGLIAVSGALTSESYILSKNCKITGGFAFYTWFAKEHAGDFVITLGGYHPAFKKPDHYPLVDRLGFNWKLDDHFSVKGGGYFALTPSCLMAGGALDATYVNGNLKAWFNAYMDFIIKWKPFYYDISMGVSIGASYRVDCWFVQHTFSIELSAALHIWGPEFAGKARVNWYIISFTIEFGNQGVSAPTPLSWSEFSTSFLPAAANDNQKPAGDAGQENFVPSVCNVNVGKGLRKEIDGADGQKKWLIKADDFTITTGSAIPCTAIAFNSNVISLEGRTTNLGILPMGAGVKLDSGHSVLIEKQLNNGGWQTVPAGYIESSVITGGVPAALWGLMETKAPSADLISDVAIGLKLAVAAAQYYQLSADIDLKIIQDIPVNLAFSWGSTMPPAQQSYRQDESMSILMNTLMDERKVVPLRKNILTVLKDNGLCDADVVSLADTAKNANNLLLAPPVLVNLGAELNCA
jgi:hypothetical protein